MLIGHGLNVARIVRCDNPLNSSCGADIYQKLEISNPQGQEIESIPLRVVGPAVRFGKNIQSGWSLSRWAATGSSPGTPTMGCLRPVTGRIRVESAD